MKTEIAPNVYWLGGRSSNIYLCVDDDGLTLIDTGMPSGYGQVMKAIGELSRQPSELKRILVTHADIDHAGSAAALHGTTGAQVVAAAETAALLQQGKSPKHMPRIMQALADTLLKYKPVPKAAILICEEGDELPVLGGLRVIASPGHTAEHHSFYSSSTGVLFAGDALDTRGGKLKCSTKLTLDHEAARRSAVRLVELAPAVIACGHGRPLFEHSSDDLMHFFNQLRQ